MAVAQSAAGAGRTGSAEVSFGVERRPEEATRIRLESFDGPLALLLSLIEQRQLDVLSVKLGELAGAYLDAVARLEKGRLPMLSAFVGICAQLILIKSRALLPRAEPPATPVPTDAGDPEEELRARLILYRRYRDAGQRLAERVAGGGALFHREPGAAAASGVAGARPAALPSLDPALLRTALSRSAALTPPAPEPPAVLPRTVTLEDRAAIIRQCLRQAPQIVLQDLLRDVTDRVVVAVTFLALLEMAKGREVVVEQHEPWGPIHVRGGPDNRNAV
ncbi:segregation/condensation protein A [soil metagenome]